MNTFNITLTQPQPDDWMNLQIRIDGEVFHDGRSSWDFLELVRSADTPGGYFILTCECGEPGCNGITDPFIVEHADAAVRWLIPTPYARWGRDEPVERTETRFEFDAAQYKSEVARMLADLRAAADVNPSLRIEALGSVPKALRYFDTGKYGDEDAEDVDDDEDYDVDETND